ncbi:MAG: acyl carrier protein [Actinomycetota bacterium]
MNTAVDVAQRIHDFINEEVLFDDASVSLTDETPLLNGILDSLALTQLVSFIEEEFAIELDDSEISRNNFTTVSRIQHLVLNRAAG